MSWWGYVVIAVPLLFGIYVFVVGTGYLTMVLSHEENPAADSMYDTSAGSPGGQRSRDVAAIHPYARGKTAIHHSGGPVDRAA